MSTSLELPDLDRVEPSFSVDLRPPTACSQLQNLVPSPEHRARSPFTSSQTAQLLRSDPTLDKYRYFKQAFTDRPTPVLPPAADDTTHNISFSTSVPPLLASPAELSLLEPRPLPTSVSHGASPFPPPPMDPLGVAPPAHPALGPGSDTYLNGQEHHPMAGQEPAAKHRRTVSSPSIWDPQVWETQHPASQQHPAPSQQQQQQPPVHGLPPPGLSASSGGLAWEAGRQLVTHPPMPPVLTRQPGAPVVASCSSTGGTPLASPLASHPASGQCSPVGRLSGTSQPGSTHGLSVPSSPTIHQQQGGASHGLLPSASPKTSNGGGTSSGAAAGGAGGSSGAKNTVTSGTVMPSNVVQELLSDVPPELQPVVLAKVTQRGRGGRAPAADPRTDPNIDPRKARRILANRQSAARSKLKQKMLLETLRVNKEVLSVQQGSVQGEVARLQALVQQLTQRNQLLEEQVQALTLQQQRMSNGMPGTSSGNGAWPPGPLPGQPAMPGVMPVPGMLNAAPGAAGTSLGMQSGLGGLGGPSGLGPASNMGSNLASTLGSTAGVASPPLLMGGAPGLPATSGSQTLQVGALDDDTDGWWKDGMELGN